MNAQEAWSLAAAHWDNVALLWERVLVELQEEKERLEKARTLGKQAKDILREDRC